mgnify:CR=1
DLLNHFQSIFPLQKYHNCNHLSVLEYDYKVQLEDKFLIELVQRLSLFLQETKAYFFHLRFLLKIIIVHIC